MSRVKKLSEAEAVTLSKCFPSGVVVASADHLTQHNVIRMIKEPVTTKHRPRYCFWISMIGSMKQEELCNFFLQFVTGSSVPVDNDICITFNSLSGLSRRPIAHTCAFRLELPSTYHDFEEFKSVLNSEYAG